MAIHHIDTIHEVDRGTKYNRQAMLTPTKEALFEQTTAASMVVTVAKNDDVTAESSWTCSCGKQWPSTHKRCGNTKCQKVSKKVPTRLFG